MNDMNVSFDNLCKSHTTVKNQKQLLTTNITVREKELAKVKIKKRVKEDEIKEKEEKINELVSVLEEGDKKMSEGKIMLGKKEEQMQELEKVMVELEKSITKMMKEKEKMERERNEKVRKNTKMNIDDNRNSTIENEEVVENEENSKEDENECESDILLRRISNRITLLRRKLQKLVDEYGEDILLQSNNNHLDENKNNDNVISSKNSAIEKCEEFKKNLLKTQEEKAKLLESLTGYIQPLLIVLSNDIRSLEMSGTATSVFCDSVELNIATEQQRLSEVDKELLWLTETINTEKRRIKDDQYRLHEKLVSLREELIDIDENEIQKKEVKKKLRNEEFNGRKLNFDENKLYSNFKFNFNQVITFVTQYRSMYSGVLGFLKDICQFVVYLLF
jgi:chromosome segregation ATPase